MLWRRIRILWRNLTQKRRVDADLDEEIRSYQAMIEDEKLQSGSGLESAKRQALLEMEGAEQIRLEVRDARLGSTLEGIGTELRQAMRGLRRNPSLTMLAAGMLALGIGASTIIFSIVHATLLRPLPYHEPERLVQIWETRLERGLNRTSFTEANFWDLRSLNRAFTDVASLHYGSANLTGAGQPEQVSVIRTSPGFFRTLGVTPVLGRDFTEDETSPGADAGVAILGHRLWETQFGRDPGILGRTIRLDDRAYSVAGVLPPGNLFLNGQVYVPFTQRANANRVSWEYSVIGRLKDGASIESAGADLKQIAGTLESQYPDEAKGIGFTMAPSSTWLASDGARQTLWVLLAAVGALLLIACLNVASLLLARGTARQREIAVRAALGAGRWRLMRYVMLESLLLSALGTVLGLGLAGIGIRTLQTMEIGGLPRLDEASLNPWVLGFAVGIAVLSGLLAGIAPALQAPVKGITGALREGDRQTGGRGSGRLRAALVTGEVALSFLLLVGAGLLIRSFTQLVTLDHGFASENRLLFSVSLPRSYFENTTGKQFVDSFLERLVALPGVEAAGAVNQRPVDGGNPGMAIDAASRPDTGGSQAAPWAGWRFVTPDYFRTVGLPLLRGRLFDHRDVPVWQEQGKPEPARRVIISNTLAGLLFPNEDPIGKSVVLWKGQGGGTAEVVGVVGDSRERGITAGPARTVYFAYGNNAVPGQFVVHTSGNPLVLVPEVRSLLASMDPSLPLADIRSFDEVLHRSLAPQQFSAGLLAVFSAVALMLAITGIYGVLSYSMSHRTAEIGLRVALGANPASIFRMTIGKGMQPALLGVALGAVGAWWLSGYLATLLFDVKPFDPPTYVAVAALMTATALAACYFPGRRAMRTDPSVALRAE